MRPFLTAAWRNLLLLNFEVDPSLLRAWVPAGTELDAHEGACYVSLVAFQFQDARVLGVTVPLHRDFTEVNCRFYVRREVAGEHRRGVVFIREVVPRLLIAAVARLAYNEPYVTLPMRASVSTDPLRVEYGWHYAGRWQAVTATAEGQAVLPAPASHEEFVSDHAWGYTRQRNGETIEYQVRHEPWPLWRAAPISPDADIRFPCAEGLAAQLRRPRSAFIAAGSRVTVYRPTRLTKRGLA